MVTGVETAGLVIGSFPLVIGLIKSYSEGAATLKDMKLYRSVLADFVRQLNVEHCKFQSMCISVLKYAVADEQAAQEMMHDPKDARWQDEDVHEALRGRLQPAQGTLELWLMLMQNMHATLEEVGEKFRLEGAVKTSRFEKRKAWKIGLLKTYRTEMVERLAKTNADLLAFTGPPPTTSSGSYRRPRGIAQIPRLIRYHQRIAAHARALYDTFKHKLEYPECQCGVAHTANLTLDGEHAAKAAGAKLHFRVLFSTEMEGKGVWREYRLEAVEETETEERKCGVQVLTQKGAGFRFNIDEPEVAASTTSLVSGDRPVTPVSPCSSPASNNRAPRALSVSNFSVRSIFRSRSPRPETPPCTSTPLSSTSPDATPVHPRKSVAFTTTASLTPPADPTEHPPITCLCTAITTPQAPTSPQCMGMLCSPISPLKHLVYTTRTPSPAPQRLLPLTELYDLPKPSLHTRLVLGLRLTAAVMQLGATAWLGDGAWSARDILFPLYGAGRVDLCEEVLARPVVHRRFNHAAEMGAGGRRQLPIAGCHPALYALGVVLVEVFYWRALCAAGGDGRAEEYLRAREAAFEIDCEAGKRYGDAVRGCILGGLMVQGAKGGEEGRKEVYEKVVLVLEENLRSFEEGN